MTDSLQLLGLLALAFLASAGVGIRRRGLSLAGLFVLLGVLLGPMGLSLIDEDTRALWHPLVSLSSCWLGLLFGVRLRAGAFARAGVSGVATALLGATGVLAVVAGGLYWMGPSLGLPISAVTAFAIATVSSSSGQAAIRFARHRLGASGPLERLLDRVTSLDDLVPIGAVLVMSVALPATQVYPGLAHWPGLVGAAAVGLGLLLTSVFALSAGRKPTLDRTWIVLLGSVILVTGLAGRLGVPEIAVGLVAGLALPMAVPLRLLARVVSTTERPITVLLLVLIGAQLAPTGPIVVIAAAALALRIVGKVAVGAWLPRSGAGRFGAGLGLLGHDGLALAAAAQIELLYGARSARRCSWPWPCRRSPEICWGRSARWWRSSDASRTGPTLRWWPMSRREPGRAVSVASRFLGLGLALGAMFLAAQARAQTSGAQALLTVASLGFLLVAGDLSAQLLGTLGLPHLTGYLAAGIVAGPYVLRLIPEGSVVQLHYVNGLALSLIAFSAGAELTSEMIRKSARSIGWGVLAQSVVLLLLLSLTFLALSPLMVFLHGQPLRAVIGVALLWGVVAVVKSPAAVLGVLAETDAGGPLTSYSIAMVVLLDVVVLVLFQLVVDVRAAADRPDDRTVAGTAHRGGARATLVGRPRRDARAGHRALPGLDRPRRASCSWSAWPSVPPSSTATSATTPCWSSPWPASSSRT